MSYVYLLLSNCGSTYVGATVDLERRLKQHNKELKGGARATGIKVEQGYKWTRVVHVSGFPDWQSALQFEWRWKQLSRKISLSIKPIERRLKALNTLLSLERPTKNAILYTEWPSPPEVHIEIDDIKREYDKILEN